MVEKVSPGTFPQYYFIFPCGNECARSRGQPTGRRSNGSVYYIYTPKYDDNGKSSAINNKIMSWTNIAYINHASTGIKTHTSCHKRHNLFSVFFCITGQGIFLHCLFKNICIWYMLMVWSILQRLDYGRVLKLHMLKLATMQCFLIQSWWETLLPCK